MMNFTEKQRFTQWWIWLILIIIGSIAVISIVKQLILKESFGNQPMSDLGLIIFAFFVLVFISLIFFMKLVTIIDRSGIKMHFVPFVKKQTTWEEIKAATIVNYGFVGGWGIRFGSQYGTIYNIRGKMGLAIELKNGKKFLIGTQKPEELNRVIQDSLK